MTFRSRLLLAFAVAAAVPLAILALGVRREVADRITSQYRESVRAQLLVAQEDLQREATEVARRLATVRQSLVTNDSFRLSIVRAQSAPRSYLLNYATGALAITNLSMLQIQDADGRILSSGHFRNEFDRMEPRLPRLLAAAGATGLLTYARSPEGPFLVLARVDSLQLGGERLYLIGGIRVDSSFLARLARGNGLHASLSIQDTVIAAAGATDSTAVVADTLRIGFASTSVDREMQVQPAAVVVRQSTAALGVLLNDMNRWFYIAAVAVVLAVIALAYWLAVRLSKPLAELAQATSRVDLTGEEVAFAADRSDEIGTLARRLASMSSRLRNSALQLRDAERRSTVGDMARQVNHDIKNGLIPIRNVLRHLADVQSHDPASLPAVFQERKGTLDSSLDYLDTLARNYAQLTPRGEQGAVDVNAIVRGIATASGDAEIQTRLAPALPNLRGDPIALRRIIDNLVRNALESLDGRPGSVVVSTSRAADGSVLVQVSDTGKGMTAEEQSSAFRDFFTTKSTGTGLGLSVVRRLTADMNGAVHVRSEPGRGTTFTLQFPVPPANTLADA